ncbi:MAG TPA: trehalase family glycosidase [Rubrivivax sp.]|nr:trehalase family glycosidase [Rubrivivax sp.]
MGRAQRLGAAAVDRRTRPAAPRPRLACGRDRRALDTPQRRRVPETGKLVEQYDVTEAAGVASGGEYPLQDGFGWTNEVLRRLLALYPQALADPPPR